MEVDFSIVVMLFKIAILASIYSILIVSILVFISKFVDNEKLRKITKEKKSTWFAFGFLFSILLFIYSFTYWGNHGLGDEPRIPVGNWNVVENTNWQFSSLRGFKDGEGNEIVVSRFITKEEYFCGEFDQGDVLYDFKNQYFVLNMKTNEIIEFGTSTEYNKYARMKNLPIASDLLTFRKNYHDYFGGWKFWLLP